MSRSLKRRSARFVLSLSIIAVAALGAKALVSMKPPPEKKDIDELDLLVDVLPLANTTVAFTVDTQGTVRPRTETLLSAELSGAIVSVSDTFIAGGQFARNEVLMRIDPSNYSVAVDQAKALLKQREIEHDGAIRLREKGYQAESEVASAAAALASARAGLTRAERDLQRTYIRLPYAGIVRSKDVDIGQYVTPGTRLGVAFATDYAEVRLPLTDRDLAFVKLPGVGSTDDQDGPAVMLQATRKGQLQEWSARITRTEGVVDETTRVTYAVARIDDPYCLSEKQADGIPLPIGSFVRAQIQGNTFSNLIRVPRGVLRGSDQLLLVDAENQLQRRTVQVLRSDGEYAYLSGGVSAGEQVALTNIASPINGMRVRIHGAEDDAVRHAEADGDSGGNDSDAGNNLARQP